MLLLSISKQFLKKLIPIVAVIGVVLGCLGIAFKKEREVQAEYRKNLEQVNEKYKNYKNGKEYVDGHLNKLCESAKTVIMKCVEKDEYGKPIIYYENVYDKTSAKTAIMKCVEKDEYGKPIIYYENVYDKTSENGVPVRDAYTLGIKSLDDGKTIIEFILMRFDINDKLVYGEIKKFGLNEEIYNHECDENTTYGDYLNNLTSNIEETLDKYDDIVKMHDENIRILEAYGLREKNKSAENMDLPCADDINNAQIENKIPALKCLAAPMQK